MKKVSMEFSKKMLQEMSTDRFKKDFSNMLRSRYPLFFITTNEEMRLVKFLEHYCKVKGYDCMLWDSYNGLVQLVDREVVGGTSEELKSNPLAALDYVINESRNYAHNINNIKEKKEKGTNGVLYVLLDFFRFITDSPDIERRFKAITEVNSFVTTIVTGPYYQSTDVLHDLMPVIDFPYANKQEIKNALYDVVRGASNDIPDIIQKTQDIEEQLVAAASGLTLLQGQTAFSKSLVEHRDWDIPTILDEKKQIISKSEMIDFFDKPVSMNDVGGLKRLVKWIGDRKSSFSEEAEAYGLKKPRGALFLGMPGCVVGDTKIKIKKISKKGKYKIYR